MNATSGGLQERKVETYRSMISIATEAVKALHLINGGAIVALLAYLGQVTDRATVAPRIASPTLWFIGGLVAGVLTFLGMYLTQLTYFNELYKSDSATSHTRWLVATIGSGLASVACFGFGAYKAVLALAGP